MSKIKNLVFGLISVAIGILIALSLMEVAYRFYLFGPRLSFQDNRVIDKTHFPETLEHIFFVGDSFTQGYPFPIDHSYPVLLEEKLRNSDIKITNFALINSDIYDEVNIIKQISRLGPSLIIWGLTTNDICRPMSEKKDLNRLDEYNLKEFSSVKAKKISHIRHALYDLPRDCLFRAKMSLFSTVKEVLNTYSYIYILLKRHLGNKKPLTFLKVKHDLHYELEEVHTGVARYYKKDLSPSEVFGATFEAILYAKSFLDGKNIALIIFYVPQEANLNQELFEKNITRYDTSLTSYDRRMPIKHIELFCRNNNITFIDPSRYMEGELNQGKELFMKLDRHYNHFGNNLVAQFLSRNNTFLSEISKGNK